MATPFMKSKRIVAQRSNDAERRTAVAELRERLARRAAAHARAIELRDKIFKSVAPHEKTGSG